MTLADLRVLVSSLPRYLDDCEVMLGVGEYFSDQVVVSPQSDGNGTTIVFISSIENEADLPSWEPLDVRRIPR